MGLKELVDVYIVDRKVFLAQEKTVLGQIQDAVKTEIPHLNALLPPGYSIGEIEVSPQHNFSKGKPAVAFREARKDGQYVDPQEFPDLNQRLKVEYRRMSRQYGVRVDGFVHNIIIG